MSIHKLTAGSGYDYLTRQVAAMDATDKGHTGLASYYTEKGETPGVWVGSGMEGIDGLAAGDIVTADQMQALFGAGHHPLADQRLAELDAQLSEAGLALTDARRRTAVRLGTPYKVYDNDSSAFEQEVARRFWDANKALGNPGDAPLPAETRAQIRTEVGREFFRNEHGRDAADARELAAAIAKHSRPRTTAVAGYDLTFSPVKSVSTLWSVADPSVAATIERAHQAAIKDALAFIENRALFTREGTNGVRQVNVRGLIGTAFTHRDSRAGDPDLHTHVAIANKVQTKDGKWLAIDGRVLFKATVAASETYNTALEHHLGDMLGLQFAERPNPDARKRPIREIVGVDPQLNTRFSKRRMSVEQRRKVLAAAFQASHGRPPTPVETLHLAQQATLETREAKHEPRSLAEQRAAWNREAIEVLGTAQRLQQMIHGALNPSGAAAALADSRWFSGAADRILASMEGSRATWQYWHVYAEAQRQVRGATVPTNQVDQVVDMLVDEVLTGRSVSLARDYDRLEEPAQLRRRDGSSVYTVAGADLFTSARVVAAEERLVATAGRVGGFAVDQMSVDLALLEAAANGPTLNAGQSTLVREMATSGRRLQLAIAPAGSGKTTAMRALAGAWADGGGTVIGLAPSAAAADALRSQIDTTTDTLAKLTHSLTTGEMPSWVANIDAKTLVVIDEAGMADTLSLDTAVGYILDRGASVRLIGDDQQLAAIGAGGVLRDIRATHGALHLSELVRFRDPAEGAASLALREGRNEAIGFYLDRQRVHVGDLATMTDEVFGAWQADRGNGLDSLMLAPTRELTSELNQRARAARLEGADPAAVGPVRTLADGNDASVGDLIITRSNDRRLRTSPTDWVKNGDRWSIVELHHGGDLSVQHAQNGRLVRLPREYVDASTELGYACTVHTAQGVTADTTHCLATGTESRQQLYTAMTRGAQTNHLYLEIVGDGDPHTVVHPTLVHPLTPTDVMEAMLARDDSPVSASSMVREHASAPVRLGHATQRYLDSLYVAAEDHLGPETVARLDQTAETLLPGLVDEAAWPTLRAHLLLVGATGQDPVEALTLAAADRELTTAADRAAVLDWRLDASGLRNAGAGPLPWMPAVPTALAENPRWGDYLTRRAELVADLAEQVHTTALEATTVPEWASNGTRPDAATVAQVQVWRAAMQVAPEDRRPTGPAQLAKAPATYQRRLARRVQGENTPALREWKHLIETLAPTSRSEAFTPLLAERLAAMSRAGVTAHSALRSAAELGPLPDDHAAAALWWRMARHLTPPVAAQIDDPFVTSDWVERLPELVGAGRADRLRSSSWWPALVTTVDHALQRGWVLEDLLDDAGPAPADVDEAQAMTWRISVLLDPIPDHESPIPDYEPHQEPPEDMWDGVEVPAWAEVADVDVDVDGFSVGPVDRVEPDVLEHEVEDVDDVERDLLFAALSREGTPTQWGPSDADLRRAYELEQEWAQSPVSRERMAQINELSAQFFESHLSRSWAGGYLQDRLGHDLAGDPRFRPGHAPAGWTRLVDHLRRHGVSDEEMLAAGVATTAKTGRLIDRFRDRVMFPVIHDGEVLGFVGRRDPRLTDADKAGPKYLNTGETALFKKGAQLFGVDTEALATGGKPVIVEGPVDAIAVTVASAGVYIGVAPLGTSLTEEQAAQLASMGVDPIVATDPDLAGQVAAERDFWTLAARGMDPGYAQLPDGLDPADVLTQQGAAALMSALTTPPPLGEHLVAERVANLAPEAAAEQALDVLAARPAHTWKSGLERLQDRLSVVSAQTRRALRDRVKVWDADPRKAAQTQLSNAQAVRARLQAAAVQPPAQRWAALAQQLDPRLVAQQDWPATAALMQQAHDSGHDVEAITKRLVEERPLGGQPAQDLRYRMVASTDLAPEHPEETVAAPVSRGSEQPRRQVPGISDRRPGRPRR